MNELKPPKNLKKKSAVKLIEMFLRKDVMAFCHLRETIQSSIMYRTSLLLGKEIKSTNTSPQGRGQRVLRQTEDRLRA